MRKTSLITAILLLSAVWAVAQSTPSTPPQSTTPSSSYPSTAPSQSTTPDTSSTTTTSTQTSKTSDSSTAIEGCLSGSSGSFTLTDQSGKAWQLAGDTSKLTEHVGHQVRVMGSDAGGSAASSSSGDASAASGSGAAAGAGSTFTVKKVKMISSSCSTSK